jgi:hypothetical protein
MAFACGGLVGALNMMCSTLNNKFPKPTECTVDSILKYLFSGETLRNFDRCFFIGESFSLPSNVREYLILRLTRFQIFPPSGDLHFEKARIDLTRGGILLEGSNFEFASPLAAICTSKYLFPNRATMQRFENPFQLVLAAVATMSANTLRNSITGSVTPKEAKFQHLFMEGLQLCTVTTTCICPELSRCFPDVDGSVNESPGELDFYVNGELQWGIELLRDGAGIGKHIARFSERGIYASLKVKAWVVVDFRANKTGLPTQIEALENRMTLFFKLDDFTKCTAVIHSASECYEFETTLQL